MSSNCKDTDDINETSFQDSIELFSLFIRENTHLLTVMGVLTALLVYISNNIPNTASETIIGITYASVFGVISILFLAFGYRAINTITNYGGPFQPATLFITLFSGMFLGLIGPLSLSISINSTSVKLLVSYWVFPVVITLCVWVRNIVGNSNIYTRLSGNSKLILMAITIFTLIAQHLLIRTEFLELGWFVAFPPFQRLGIIETFVYSVSLILFLGGIVGALFVVAGILIAETNH